MCHVRLDQMPGREGAAQTELAGQYGSGNDTREALRILAWVRGVGAAHAEEVEHGALGLEDGTTTDGTDFDRRHGDGDLEITIIAAKD